MHFGMHLFMACAPSQTPTQRYAEAIEQAVMAPSIQQQVQLTEMLLQWAMRSSAASQFEALTKLLDHIRRMDFDSVDQTMGVLGDADHCRARLRTIVAELKPGRVITLFDFGGRVPHAQVLESMQLFSEAILPEWRAQGA